MGRWFTTYQQDTSMKELGTRRLDDGHQINGHTVSRTAFHEAEPDQFGYSLMMISPSIKSNEQFRLEAALPCPSSYAA